MNVIFFINEVDTREAILHKFCIYNGETPPAPEPGRKDVRVFISDRDTVWSLRHKIAFITKRMFAYQFLYWQSGEAQQTYPFRFLIDHMEYNVLSVAETVFDFRSRIHIYPLDYVSITKSGLWNPTADRQIVATINLLDYETIYGNIKLSSEPQMEAFYYNSVIRYWPQFSYQDFVKRMLYGLVNVPSFSIDPLVESFIMFEQFETHSSHASTLITARFLRILSDKVSTRILFDIIPTNQETYMLYLKHNGVVYRKVHNHAYRSETSDHPIDVASMKNDDLYIVYQSGTFHYSFQSDTVVVTHSPPPPSLLGDDDSDGGYLRISNEMLTALETQLAEKYTHYEQMARLQSSRHEGRRSEDAPEPVDVVLDVMVSWGAKIGQPEFRRVREWFKLLSDSNMVIYDGSTREDSFSIRFVYVGFPTENMTYVDIMNPTLNKIGHLIKFSNVADSIAFQIMGVTLDEFEFISSFVISFLDSEFRSTLPEHEADEGPVVESAGVKRLMAVDPVLYKLPNGNLYSVKCQRGRQPVAYKAYEKKLADPTLPLYKFRNFTTGDPMYYQCNARFPILNFRTDLHDDGKCVPCCGSHNKNSGNINAECLRSGRVASNSPMVTEITDRKKKIIILFNKPLSVGRMSYVNATIYEILGYSLGKVKRYDKARVIGVEQRAPPLLLNVGFFYSLLYLLGEANIKLILARCDPLFRSAIEAVFFHRAHFSPFFLYVDPSSKTPPERQPWVTKLIDYIYHTLQLTVIQVTPENTVVIPPLPHANQVVLIVRNDYGVFPVVSSSGKRQFMRQTLKCHHPDRPGLSVEVLAATFPSDIVWLCNLDYGTSADIGAESLMVYGALVQSKYYLPCLARKADFVSGEKKMELYKRPEYSFDELNSCVLSKLPASSQQPVVHIKYRRQYIGVMVDFHLVPYKRVNEAIMFYNFKEIFYDPFELNAEMFYNKKLSTQTPIKWRNNIYNMLLLERRRTGTDNVVIVPDSAVQDIEIENIYQSCAEKPEQMQCDQESKKLKITKTIYDEIKDVAVSTVPNFGIVNDMEFIRRDNELIHLVDQSP